MGYLPVLYVMVKIMFIFWGWEDFQVSAMLETCSVLSFSKATGLLILIQIFKTNLKILCADFFLSLAFNSSLQSALSFCTGELTIRLFLFCWTDGSKHQWAWNLHLKEISSSCKAHS